MDTCPILCPTCPPCPSVLTQPGLPVHQLPDALSSLLLSVCNGKVWLWGPTLDLIPRCGREPVAWHSRWPGLQEFSSAIPETSLMTRGGNSEAGGQRQNPRVPPSQLGAQEEGLPSPQLQLPWNPGLSEALAFTCPHGTLSLAGPEAAGASCGHHGYLKAEGSPRAGRVLQGAAPGPCTPVLMSFPVLES